MSIMIGSARIDEKGNASGGAAGDQKQTTTPDYKGEVSQQEFYESSKGWDVLRAKSAEHGEAIAKAMAKYCNDANVGYDQSNRTAIMSYSGSGKTECDCSSLIRRCIKDATGKDVGNFNTANEKSTILESGLFDYVGKYESGMKLYDGDVLVTCTKGHTVAVTKGNNRSSSTSKSYYPKCASKYTSIVEALASVGEKDTSYSHRVKIAKKNGIACSSSYTMNVKLLSLLKSGKLVKA